MKPLEKLATRLGFRPKMQKPQPAEPEVLRNTSKPAVGLFALLSEEQKAKAKRGTGNEDFGPSDYSLKGKSCA